MDVSSQSVYSLLTFKIGENETGKKQKDIFFCPIPGCNTEKWKIRKHTTTQAEITRHVSTCHKDFTGFFIGDNNKTQIKNSIQFLQQKWTKKFIVGYTLANFVVDEVCFMCDASLAEVTKVVGKCGHIFCLKCCLNWLRINSCDTCPSCKVSLFENVATKDIEADSDETSNIEVDDYENSEDEEDDEEEQTLRSLGVNKRGSCHECGLVNITQIHNNGAEDNYKYLRNFEDCLCEKCRVAFNPQEDSCYYDVYNNFRLKLCVEKALQSILLLGNILLQRGRNDSSYENFCPDFTLIEDDVDGYPSFLIYFTEKKRILNTFYENNLVVFSLYSLELHDMWNIADKEEIAKTILHRYIGNPTARDIMKSIIKVDESENIILLNHFHAYNNYAFKLKILIKKPTTTDTVVRNSLH
jgi:hypothetical protein